ncbi:GNAT family N-acetyltransferase [Methanocella arvoryzae]|uniref:BioF2-like acetyltransferase domain-containing protein n=1 Tax=Methanocella arvoryzae (strain DSM 22066 / NBRC 105507 / MRE50) TaxID=351160 RepID=Q0W3C7_METAR|nr:GNAT family N-acetyltransferase [Methanocella arvoryzae]CAJ37116.1 conserved hypothetical protein [Methanocella arvoryzae MRE50]
MPVELLDDRGQWDEFVETSPDSMLFHRWDFLKIIEKHSSYRLLPLGVRRGRELVCVFPLFFRSFKGLKTVFSPPPGTCVPYLGPAFSPGYHHLRQKRKESYLNDAFQEVSGELKKLVPNYISVSTVPGFDDARPFMWAGYDLGINYTYYLDLGRPLEKILEGFDPDCKKKIRAGDKYHLSIDQTLDVETFYAITRDRFASRGMGSPLLSPQYLRDILDAFPDNVQMYFAYAGDELVSLALNCAYKESLMFWLGEINIRKDIPGNELMKWEFIRQAKQQGLREVELEGAGLKHLCLFKSKFNPALRQTFVASKKDPLGAAAEWAYKNVLKKNFTAGLKSVIPLY